MVWILRGHRHDLKLSIAGGFRLGGWDVADGLEHASIVEPANPFEGGELHGLERAPRTAPMDHLGLEEADDGFSQDIVVRIPDTANRRFDARLGETLGLLNRHVLSSPDALLILLCHKLAR